MEERRHQTDREEFRGARLRVYGTNSDDPDEGRIFVWTKEGWFERIEGSSGNAAFTPIAESEADLREIIARDNPSADLAELSGEYRKTISEEFTEQSPSYRDSAGYSEDEPEDEDENQEYHQHD
jgi:hypothetical protein